MYNLSEGYKLDRSSKYLGNKKIIISNNMNKEIINLINAELSAWQEKRDSAEQHENLLAKDKDAKVLVEVKQVVENRRHLIEAEAALRILNELKSRIEKM